MRIWTRSALLALVVVGLLACSSDTGRTDAGGVILTVSHFDGLPISLSVNGTSTTGEPDFLQVQTLDLRNITKNPDVTASDLMDIQLNTYQVVYRRLDGGTTTPPTMIRRIFGNVPHGSTLTLNNLPVMDAEQLNSRPLTDLLFVNGGFDRDTGKTFIPLELQLTFYGKTLSGDEVSSNTVAWTVNVTP
jgi:hypothetical protein